MSDPVGHGGKQQVKASSGILPATATQHLLHQTCLWIVEPAAELTYSCLALVREMNQTLGVRSEHMSQQLLWSCARTQLCEQQVRLGFLKPSVPQKALIGCLVRVGKHLEDNRTTSNKQRRFTKNESRQTN